MSHRESGQIAPFITGCSPTTFSSAGTFSVQIDGTRFGTGMEVSCGSELGTISNVVITHPTATSSRVVFDLAVSAPSGSSLHNITLSNAGISNGNSKQVVTHGFTPAALFDTVTPDGAFFDASDASKMQFYDVPNQEGLQQWDSSAGIVAAFTNSYTNYGKLKAWTGKPGATGIAKDYYGASHWTSVAVMPNAGGGNPFTIGTVVYVDTSTITNTAGTQNTQIGVGVNNAYGLGGNGYYGNYFFFGSHYDDFNNLGCKSSDITAPGTYILIVTSDGTNYGCKLYLDGSHVGTNTQAATNNVSGYLKMYSQYMPTDGAIIGDIVGINRVLTATEIADLTQFWSTKYK